jgi:hypothetical protein
LNLFGVEFCVGGFQRESEAYIVLW